MKKLVLAMTVAMAMSSTAFAQKSVKNVYASSPNFKVELFQNNEQNVQLKRYLFEGYNTLCLPMSLTAEQLGDIRVERLVGILQEGTTLNLYFADCTNEGIHAGVPYLIYSPKTQYLSIKKSEAKDFSNELKAIRLSDKNGNIVTFSSSWESIAKDGRYGIPAQQNVTPLESVLIRTTADKQFLPTRCGFSWEQQAPSANELNIVHAGDMEVVTAIDGISLDNSLDSNLYDLQGRKVNGNAKGIVVQKGKKMLVK